MKRTIHNSESERCITMRELKDYINNLPEDVLEECVVLEQGMQNSSLCASIVHEDNTFLFSAYLWSEENP